MRQTKSPAARVARFIGGGARHSRWGVVGMERDVDCGGKSDSKLDWIDESG